MYNLKKGISLFVAILMVISFVSCASDDTGPSEKNEDTSVTTAASTTSEIYYEPDDLPELDFGGETVTMISRGLKNGGFSFYETNLTVEELTSDVLNDSIYNRGNI